MTEIEVTVYRHRTQLNRFVVTPDPDGQTIPEREQWLLFRPPMTIRARALPVAETQAWREAFQRDGYYTLPRDTAFFTEIEGVPDPRPLWQQR